MDANHVSESWAWSASLALVEVDRDAAWAVMARLSRDDLAKETICWQGEANLFVNGDDLLAGNGE